MIEKSFDDLKNELDMKRLRCHNGDTGSGRTFVAFLSLIVRSYMLKQLRPMMRQNDYTFRKILIELNKIRCISITPNAKPNLMNPLTKLQRSIFESLDLPIPQENECDNSCGILGMMDCSIGVKRKERVISFQKADGFEELRYLSHEEMLRFVIDKGSEGFGIQ